MAVSGVGRPGGAARNTVRYEVAILAAAFGVAVEGEIVKLCGWKTRDMFDRYNIIDAADLSRAVARRFSGKQAANKRQTKRRKRSRSRS